jgi:hypothetical protein
VLATSTGGIALKVSGRASFSTSGVATVRKGNKTVTVTAPGTTDSNIVLATIQKPHSGVAIEGAQPGHGKITITLSGKAPAAITIGWLVIA